MTFRDCPHRFAGGSDTAANINGRKLEQDSPDDCDAWLARD
jgi:hypothetical protein